MTERLEGLTKPLKLGKLNIRNRIWNSPLWTRTATVNGEISDRTIAHYAARAKGGCGVISTEACAVDGNHHWLTPQIGIWDEVFLPGHRRLVEAVHVYGTPIICQLHHAGMFGADPVSPSGVPCADLGKIGVFIEPRVLTTQEVEEIRDKFIAAACRAQAVGYDGVEVHGATAYLLEQFFSPHNNKRNDKYGGTLEKRMELALEIIRGIRAACGPDYIIGYCGADCDWVEGGITHDQTLALAAALERAGLSYFDLQTDGTYETFHRIECSAGYRRQPVGQFDKTAQYKKVLHIPVTTRGTAQYDPREWNRAFLNDECDAVRLGKQMLADPETANKAISGRIEDIRACILCGNCINSGEVMPYELSCSINPGLGRYEKPVEKAAEKKKVVIIGGGPGGIEAARVAALRGHQVTLFEKNPELGGNLYIASLPTGKERFNNFIRWGRRQLDQLGVDVKLGTEADEAAIKALSPDVVMVATGAKPLLPPIEGIDGPNIVTAEDILTKKVRPGKNIVIAGAGEVGIETADFIMVNSQPQSLTIVEMKSDLAMDMNPMDKAMLFGNGAIFPSYFARGLRPLLNTKIKRFTEQGLDVIDTSMNEYSIPADQVILAMGYASDTALYEQIRADFENVILLGDAVKPGKIVSVIYQANTLAREI